MSNTETPAQQAIEFIKTVVYAVVIALTVRTVAFEPFNIPSGSLIPTMLVGDYLFVSKYSYGYSHFSLPLGPNLFSGRVLASEPKQGDIVVFRLPTDTSVDYIKRLIGLPGDHIRMSHGRLYINGILAERERLDDYVYVDRGGNVRRVPRYQETLPSGVKHEIIEVDDDHGRNDDTQEYVVPPGHYFFMGDNRDDSQDSRVLSAVGYVPAENLIGRAEFRFFSTDGSAALWEVWKWPTAIRWTRLFTAIH